VANIKDRNFFLIQSVPSWELQQWKSPVRQQNFWNILASLFPSPMNFLFSFTRHHPCNNDLQQNWYRTNETKQELLELKMLLEKSVNLILELRDRVKFMKGVEGKLHSQFQNRMNVVDKSQWL
jgi:hypothetical protein